MVAVAEKNFVRQEREMAIVEGGYSMDLDSASLMPVRPLVPENDEVVVVFCNAYPVKFGHPTLSQSVLERAERPSIVKTPSDARAPQTSLTVAPQVSLDGCSGTPT